MEYMPYVMAFCLMLTVVSTWVNGASKGYREGEKEGRAKALMESQREAEKRGFEKGLKEGQKLAEKRYG